MTIAAPDSVHSVGTSTEDEKAGGRHPDQSEIDERREHRSRRDAMGKDQQPMPEAAPEAERGEQHPEPGLLRPLPGGSANGVSMTTPASGV